MPFVVADRVKEPLYAVVPYFNPWRWKTREKHTIRALQHFHAAGAVIVLVEIAFNRREFSFSNFTLDNAGLDGTLASCEVLGAGHGFRHMYVPLRSKDELWLKENAINAGVARLPHNWKQVCWLDSDIHFLRPNWVGECIHKLQHYSFLQMFSHARDLGPNYEMLPADYPHANGNGFVSAFHAGTLSADVAGGYYGAQVFPGLAWASTREAWDAVGGLIDFAIWGGADWHMANALIEKNEGMMRNDLHRNYKKLVMQWYYRCHTHIRRNVGAMEGTIIHHWHGKKTDRGYNEKHRLMAQVGFDPLRHLKRDYQNLWQLHDDRSSAFVKLRDLMRKIAKERNEDGNEV